MRPLPEPTPDEREWHEIPLSELPAPLLDLTGPGKYAALDIYRVLLRVEHPDGSSETDINGVLAEASKQKIKGVRAHSRNSIVNGWARLREAGLIVQGATSSLNPSPPHGQRRRPRPSVDRSRPATTSRRSPGRRTSGYAKERRLVLDVRPAPVIATHEAQASGAWEELERTVNGRRVRFLTWSKGAQATRPAPGTPTRSPMERSSPPTSRRGPDRHRPRRPTRGCASSWRCCSASASATAWTPPPRG